MVHESNLKFHRPSTKVSSGQSSWELGLTLISLHPSLRCPSVSAHLCYCSLSSLTWHTNVIQMLNASSFVHICKLTTRLERSRLPEKSHSRLPESSYCQCCLILLSHYLFNFCSLLSMIIFFLIFLWSFVAMKKYCAFVHALVNPLRGSDSVRRAQVKVPHWKTPNNSLVPIEYQVCLPCLNTQDIKGKILFIQGSIRILKFQIPERFVSQNCRRKWTSCNLECLSSEYLSLS